MADDDSQRRDKQPVPPPIEFIGPNEQPPTSTTLPEQPPAAWVPHPDDYLQAARPRRAMKPEGAAGGLHRVGGILLLLAGLIGIAAQIYYAFNMPSVTDYANYTVNNSALAVAFNQICGLISIWAQAAAILGGVMAFQRMNWRLAVACGVLSVLTYGFFAEASFLGVIGLLVVLRARREFVS